MLLSRRGISDGDGRARIRAAISCRAKPLPATSTRTAPDTAADTPSTRQTERCHRSRSRTATRSKFQGLLRSGPRSTRIFCVLQQPCFLAHPEHPPAINCRMRNRIERSHGSAALPNWPFFRDTRRSDRTQRHANSQPRRSARAPWIASGWPISLSRGRRCHRIVGR
jgi:hypothetical protein